ARTLAYPVPRPGRRLRAIRRSRALARTVSLESVIGPTSLGHPEQMDRRVLASAIARGSAEDRLRGPRRFGRALRRSWRGASRRWQTAAQGLRPDRQAVPAGGRRGSGPTPAGRRLQTAALP